MVAFKSPSTQTPSNVVSPEVIEHFGNVAKALSKLAANMIDVIHNNASASALEELRDAVTEYILISKRIGELSKFAIPKQTLIYHSTFGYGEIAELLPEFQPCSARIQFEKHAETLIVPLAELAVNDRYLDTNYIPF